jgi:putative toxin-antitoxin system antitoxin component (TIGR02293 family)
MDLVKLSKKGVSRGALNHLIKHSSLTLQQMAALLPVTVRTIQRYSTEDRFSPAVSEQIISIAQIMARGEEVFGDCIQFKAWLNRKSPALSNKKPFDLLSSRFGGNLIIDELGRIEHGVIS